MMTEADWHARFPRIAAAKWGATTDGFEEREITNEAGCFIDAGVIPADRPVLLAEIGVCQAKSACILMRRYPLLQYLGVDYWPGWPEVREICMYNLARYPGRWRLIEDDSTLAADQVADQSCDLVFIDASKAEGKYLADCLAWWPKVKPGGWMFGHDVCHPTWTEKDGRDITLEQVMSFSVHTGVKPECCPKRNTWSMQKLA